MEVEKKGKMNKKIRKRLPLIIFLVISTIIFFLASSLLLEDAYKDIMLVVMIWALPLFIH